MERQIGHTCFVAVWHLSHTELVIRTCLYLALQARHQEYVSAAVVNSSKMWQQHSPTIRPLWYNESFPPVDFDTLSDEELTIVTAYFDIGEFQKGYGGSMFTPKLYQKWLTIFAQIKNPVIAFFDNADHAALMQVLRKNYPKTRIVVIDRRTLWSFRELQPHIAKIFSRQGYPFNPPNTVVPNYSAAMHSKYELMRWAIRDNPFRSTYICWLDVGLFRDLAYDSVASAVSGDDAFRLGVPPNLDSSKVAYSVVFPDLPHTPLSAQQVVVQNSVWVCGCFFIGRIDVMWQWTFEYLLATERMVSEEWMGTDQQVIYWLFLGEGKEKLQPKTSIQLYKVDDGSNVWFYLGYLAKKAGEHHYQRRPTPHPVPTG